RGELAEMQVEVLVNMNGLLDGIRRSDPLADPRQEGQSIEIDLEATIATKLLERSPCSFEVVRPLLEPGLLQHRQFVQPGRLSAIARSQLLANGLRAVEVSIPKSRERRLQLDLAVVLLGISILTHRHESHAHQLVVSRQPVQHAKLRERPFAMGRKQLDLLPKL